MLLLSVRKVEEGERGEQSQTHWLAVEERKEKQGRRELGNLIPVWRDLCVCVCVCVCGESLDASVSSREFVQGLISGRLIKHSDY